MALALALAALILANRNLGCDAAAAASLDGATASPVGGQLHSYNDLRLWPQALAKALASARATSAAGAEAQLLFKLDPQYLPAATCAHFPRARAADPRGCLLFNHDTISTRSRPTFNSSDDIAPMLASAALAPFVRGGDAAPARLTISFCFKGCGGSKCPCDGATDPATANFLSLVDELFAALNATIGGGGLCVDILLDGAGNPGSAACLSQRWRPWNSVFISGDDPDGAFTSNDPTKGWDRLAVLNNPQGLSFGTAAALGFGKFNGSGILATPSPYICWEPSDAAGIASTVQSWAASPGAPNPAGLRFAINIDAAQLDVHAAYALTTLKAVSPALAPVSSGWHIPMGAGSAARPAATTLPGGLLLLTWLEGDVAKFMTRRFVAPGAPLATAGSGTLPLQAPPRSAAVGGFWSVSALTLANGSVVIVSTTACFATAAGQTTIGSFLEEALLVVVDAGSGLVSFAATSAPRQPPASAPAASIVLAAPTSPFAVAVSGCGAAGGAASEPAFACRLWAWAPPRPFRGTACLVTGAVFGGPATRPFNASAACLFATQAEANSGLLGNVSETDIDGLAVAAVPFVLGGSVDPRLAFAASFSAAGLTFGATGCALDTASGGAVGVNDEACFEGGGAPGANSSTLPLVYHVGAQPSLALALGGDAGTGGPIFLEVHSQASCPNNEADNKRADAGLCDQAPTRFSGAPYLAYGYGALAAWTRRLRATAYLALPGGSSSAPLPAPWPGASACSTELAHGAVGTGARPAAALLWSAAGHAAALVVEASASAADPLGCGVSAPVGGGAPPLALVGWPLAASFLQ